MSASLPANYLFVLPVFENPTSLIGNYYRIEAAFADVAKSFYMSCGKLVRSHREGLIKTTHSLLFVRHQFKLGFYSELRQDPSTALKHYKQAYTLLLEVRSNAANSFEIKTMAGFICYKITRLCFTTNSPMDGINHFKKHIEHFRTRIESRELTFEHQTWLSKQFSMFAGLFEQAVANGLVPSLSQHPGFYFYEAASQAIARRLCSQNITVQEPEELMLRLLSDNSTVEFLGQRPWRPGCQTLETLDPDRESEGIKALQFLEKSVSHHVIITGLISSAIIHFKKNKCFRLKKLMTVLLAQEYFVAGDYASCTAALSQVVSSLKQDNWKFVSQSLLTMCLRASFESGSGQDFVNFAQEFVSGHFAVSQEDRKLVQDALESISKGLAPSCLPTSFGSVSNKEITWSFPEPGSAQEVANCSKTIAPRFTFFVEGTGIRCKVLSGEVSSLYPVQDENQASTANQDGVSTSSSSSIPASSGILEVQAVVPKVGISRTPIQITFTFTNKTASVLPLELSIGNNDNFMFSGNKQVKTLSFPSFFSDVFNYF